MKKIYPANTRILALAPSARGIGFAVLEGHDQLLDWGVKTVKGDKNVESVTKVEKLIARHRPEVVVLQDTKDSRRAPRIKTLSRQIVAVAKTHKLDVALFSDEQVKRKFFAEGEGTRHELAEIVTKTFPNELSLSLPPKRKLWQSEDSRMDFFYAVALALTLRLKGR